MLLNEQEEAQVTQIRYEHANLLLEAAKAVMEGDPDSYRRCVTGCRIRFEAEHAVISAAKLRVEEEARFMLHGPEGGES